MNTDICTLPLTLIVLLLSLYISNFEPLTCLYRNLISFVVFLSEFISKLLLTLYACLLTMPVVGMVFLFAGRFFFWILLWFFSFLELELDYCSIYWAIGVGLVIPNLFKKVLTKDFSSSTFGFLGWILSTIVFDLAKGVSASISSWPFLNSDFYFYTYF